jgi:hypothetical protein
MAALLGRWFWLAAAAQPSAPPAVQHVARTRHLS